MLDESLFSSDYVPWNSPDPSILLHPNIPRALHGFAPRVILGSAWWNKERLAAKEKTQNHCAACGVFGSSCKGNLRRLEGHEMYLIDWLKKTATYDKTNAICPYCHSYIHSGRLRMLLDSGKITQQHYAAVIRHGDRILESVSFSQKIMTPVEIIRAHQFRGWRLIVFGKSYKGHSSERAYVKFHKKKDKEDDSS